MKNPQVQVLAETLERVDRLQALLTGFDTALSKQWHEEEKTWREEDR